MIDVLKYTRKLEEAGFERELAELFVRGQVSMISDNVVTKADLDNTTTVLRSEMNEKFAKMETSLVIKISVLMGIQLSILGGLAKYFY